MEKLTLAFTADEIAVLNEGLVSLPYRVSANLIANLQGQINAQLEKNQVEAQVTAE